jgi:hypothetical protein
MNKPLKWFLTLYSYKEDYLRHTFRAAIRRKVPTSRQSRRPAKWKRYKLAKQWSLGFTQNWKRSPIDKYTFWNRNAGLYLSLQMYTKRDTAEPWLKPLFNQLCEGWTRSLRVAGPMEEELGFVAQRMNTDASLQHYIALTTHRTGNVTAIVKFKFTFSNEEMFAASHDQIHQIILSLGPN